MKIFKTIKEEIIPLSSQKQLILLIIIACVFQFVLFYTPVLADEAVQQAEASTNNQENIIMDELIVNDSIIKEPIINQATTTLTSLTETATSTISEVATSTINSISQNLSDTSPTTASSSPTVSTIKVIKVSSHTITAYNSEVSQTDSDPCTTANGFNLCKNNKEDSIAANFLKFGTKVRIPELFGNRVFIVRDRMNARHATRVDVWMKDHDDAMKFGIKFAKIEVLE
ncbi:MAG: hypothetical protein WC249_00110 [Patescibacteria group bacterium]|jgi:3D (Asp-Asp-Asp) domain-containing protein